MTIKNGLFSAITIIRCWSKFITPLPIAYRRQTSQNIIYINHIVFIFGIYRKQNTFDYVILKVFPDKKLMDPNYKIATLSFSTRAWNTVHCFKFERLYFFIILNFKTIVNLYTRTIVFKGIYRKLL